MTATLDEAAADPQGMVAELRRQHDECRAGLAARNSAYSERIDHQASTVDVLKAHPHLAFFDELTKMWVEQADSGPRSPGISAQRDRIIRTRPPER